MPSQSWRASLLSPRQAAQLPWTAWVEPAEGRQRPGPQLRSHSPLWPDPQPSAPGPSQPASLRPSSSLTVSSGFQSSRPSASRLALSPGGLQAQRCPPCRPPRRPPHCPRPRCSNHTHTHTHTHTLYRQHTHIHHTGTHHTHIHTHTHTHTDTLLHLHTASPSCRRAASRLLWTSGSSLESALGTVTAQPCGRRGAHSCPESTLPLTETRECQAGRPGHAGGTHLHHLVQEGEDERHACIFLGGGDHCAAVKESSETASPKACPPRLALLAPHRAPPRSRAGAASPVHPLSRTHPSSAAPPAALAAGCASL